MIRLRTAEPGDRELLWNVNQKYLYEMTLYYDDPMDGLGNLHYGHFEEYFTDPKRKALFLYDGELLIGFAMLCPYSYLGHEPDWVMAEFTVFPMYRKKRRATEAANLILENHPGRWEIKFNQKNAGARRLWTKITAPYAPAVYNLNEEETVLEFVKERGSARGA